MRRIFQLTLALAAVSSPAAGAALVLPEIGVRVVDHESGRAVAGVEVELLAKSGGDFRRLNAAVTGPDGRIRFGSAGESNVKALGLRFSWDEEGLPRRTIHLQWKAKKGEKSSRGRLLRPGKQKAQYVQWGETEGLSDCGNLVDFREIGDAFEVTFSKPRTYSQCQDTHVRNPDLGQIGRRDINASQGNFYSFDDDVSMGRQFADEIEPHQPALEDPRVVGYVRDLVGRLGRVSDMPELTFHVQVVDADVLNAFAVPGGFVFVYRGLIEATSTEAELVGVLAHEIAHVTGRHSTEGLTSNLKKLLAAEVVAALLTSGEEEDDAALIEDVISGGAYLWLMYGSRKHEAEADRLGSQYALRAGYDPNGLASFFETLGQQRGRRQTRIEHYLSEHPNDERRMSNVREMVDYFLPPSDRGELVRSSPEYAAVKERLAQLPPPAIDAEEAAGLLLTSFKATNDRLLKEAALSYGDEEEEEEQ